MDISDWREEIDSIDARLAELINRRAKCALEIGRIKGEKGQDVHSPERETAILNGVQKLNNGPLCDEAIRRIFERIIEESRKLQRGA